MHKVSETNNLGIFSLSRSARGLQMKVEYLQRKIVIFQREIWSYLRSVSGRVIEKFLSVKRLDGIVLCIQG